MTTNELHTSTGTMKVETRNVLGRKPYLVTYYTENGQARILSDHDSITEARKALRQHFAFHTGRA